MEGIGLDAARRASLRRAEGIAQSDFKPHSRALAPFRFVTHDVSKEDIVMTVSAIAVALDELKVRGKSQPQPGIRIP
jgi:hypothetical protein